MYEKVLEEMKGGAAKEVIEIIRVSSWIHHK